jgi:alginate O-acetyltransferase complex protein AlgI
MPFTEPAFLFYFLPGTLALYHLLPERFRNLLLTLASLLFYAAGEWHFVGWLLASTAATYLVARLIDAWRGSPRAAWVLAAGVVTDLFLLGVFKYWGFGARTLAQLGLFHLRLPDIALPLGISFFTFHKLSYKVDVYRGTAEVRRNPLDLLLYILFFPQLIAGPIIRYHDIAAELISRRVTLGDFAQGVRRFGIGFAKKMLVANTVAGVADQMFALEPARLGAAAGWLGVICYAVQIYFDFSGYSDMAIGMARMFGFHFLENFDHPYFSRSVTEFWRRWHMSLSRWFRDYLYVPLGGSRRSPARTYLNLSVVFLLCGLWHGASWTFVLWGAFHGALLIAERAGWSRVLGRLPRGVQHAQTLLWVLIGWVWFRSPSLHHGLSYLKALAGLGAESDTAQVVATLTPGVVLALTVGIIGSTPVASRLRERWAAVEGGSAGQALAWGRDLAIVGLLLLSTMQVASGTYNPFIYFRF